MASVGKFGTVPHPAVQSENPKKKEKKKHPRSSQGRFQPQRNQQKKKLNILSEMVSRQQRCTRLSLKIVPASAARAKIPHLEDGS